MRRILASVALAVAASLFGSSAWSQGGGPSIRQLELTVNDFATRAPMSQQQLDGYTGGFRVLTRFGPSFYICTSAIQTPFWSPETLQLRLREVTLGKSAAQLLQKIQTAERQTDRTARMSTLFEFPLWYLENFTRETASPPSDFFGAGVTDAQLLELRTGREVTVTSAAHCLSTAQADQINAEALRVLKLVHQQMAGVGQAAKPGAAKPAATQQR
jgi:hypothetical protein